MAASSGAIDAAVAIDARRHRAYVVSQVYGGPIPPHHYYPYGNRPLGRGHLSVFDTRTGQLLRTIAVGYGPQAVVIDESSGRVYISNGADGTVSVFEASRL